MSDTNPGPLWSAEDYAPAVTFSGAAKLADSQVAPLVAQARGYSTVTDRAGAKRVADDTYTDNPTAYARKLRTLVTGGNDFMHMPWFRANRVVEQGASAVSDYSQVRPSRVVEGPKYVSASGADSCIDIHPGVPAEWAKESRTVLITEGILKADAALTAQLLHSGVGAGELALMPDATAEQARAVLQQLLRRTVTGNPVLLLAIAGVGTWRKHPEWNALNLSGKDVLVAFDGDVHENWNVWQQGSALWDFLDSKSANPKLLDLGGAEASKQREVAGFPGQEKLGLDDYLSKVGDWGSLLTLTEDALPPQPERKGQEARNGDVRVSHDGTAVERFTVKQAGEFGVEEKRWETVVRIGGRVKRVDSLRQLHHAEVRTGFDGPNISGPPTGGTTVIELKWVDPATGETITRNVEGPRSLLETTPAEWGKRGAAIPNEVLMHPAWPPRYKEADAFLGAIKLNRAEETTVVDGWDTMGWVPNEVGRPVYIVGEQSLGSTHEDENANQPGVTEKVMNRASSWGVNDTYWQFVDTDNLDGWKAQIRDDIRHVMDLFVYNAPWRNPSVGPTVLSASLRPTLPARTGIVLYVQGIPGSGKTWLASFMMGFWARRPGIWNGALPGSAMDTAAAREHSLARTPLFATDDLAPTGSRQASERMTTAIGESIRAGFNGAAKRRGNADGTQRLAAAARALHVITAENGSEIGSLRERQLTIEFTRKGDTDNERGKAIEKATLAEDTPLSRLTAAMIRFWTNVNISESALPDMRDGIPDELRKTSTWEQKYRFVKACMTDSKEELQARLFDRYHIEAGASARRAGILAELFFTLDTLHALALWAGMDIDDPALRAFLDKNDPALMYGAMIDQGAQDLKGLSDSSGARNLIEAVRSVLEAGQAHLEHPTMSGVPPFQGAEDAESLNRAVGWRRDPRADEWVPGGISIGYVGRPTRKTDSDAIALLATGSAFNVAKRNHPELIPEGDKPGGMWGQVWADPELVAPEYNVSQDGQRSTTRMRLAGYQSTEGGENSESSRSRGVPVRLSALIRFDQD